MHLYICHHDKDKDFLAELKTRLDFKEDRGKITYWERNRMLGGAHIQSIRQEQLNKAEAVIMLISAYYMGEKGDLREEYKQVVAWAERKEGVLIIPVIVRAFRDWKETEIGKWVPAFDGKPIGSQGNLDEAWDEVMDWITRTLEAYKRATDPSVNFRSLESPQAIMIELAQRMQRMEDKMDQMISLNDTHYNRLLDKLNGIKDYQGTTFLQLQALGSKISDKLDENDSRWEELSKEMEKALNEAIAQLPPSEAQDFRQDLLPVQELSRARKFMQAVKLKLPLIALAAAALDMVGTGGASTALVAALGGAVEVEANLDNLVQPIRSALTSLKPKS